jgi:uncharacterized protein involved in cysteine biosynthesis
MSRQQRELSALILSFVGLFLLWLIPGYGGASASAVAMLVAIALYYLSQRMPA